MSITWTSAMSVKVKLIDDQHQRFLAILNEFYGVLHENSPLEETLRHIINELTGYAQFHFSTEEKYFDLFSYEGKDGHEALHRDYEKKVIEFKDAFEDGGGIDIAGGLLDFMENWWVNHIDIEDKKYSQCFNEHGLDGI